MSILCSIFTRTYGFYTYILHCSYQKLSTRYTSEDKRLWRYCNNNDYKIEDRLNIVTSQTETGMVITIAVQAVIAVKT